MNALLAKIPADVRSLLYYVGISALTAAIVLGFVTEGQVREIATTAAMVMAVFNGLMAGANVKE